MGILGGEPGYQILRTVAPIQGQITEDGEPEAIRSVASLFGKAFTDLLQQATVFDFSCGVGHQSVEIARLGARTVLGIDIRERLLDSAWRNARIAGVDGRFQFFTRVDEIHVPVDLVVSVEGFEHFDKPDEVLVQLSGLLAQGGSFWISFGPPWYHPLGGHLFSVFPWAHPIFTEAALLRWRSEFKSDGARHFHEVEGGLNRMTVGRFRRLIEKSPFELVGFISFRSDN